MGRARDILAHLSQSANSEVSYTYKESSRTPPLSSEFVPTMHGPCSYFTILLTQNFTRRLHHRSIMTSKIPTRRLGKEGPLIPALGYGTMGLSSHYGKVPDDETRFAILDRAYELGIRFWDTSDMYGDSEELIGKWFARTGKRDEIFLSSKFGYKVTPSNGSMPGLTFHSDPKYVREACDRSLKRLGIEHIDLYYMHVPDGKTPIEDTIETMVELKK